MTMTPVVTLTLSNSGGDCMLERVICFQSCLYRTQRQAGGWVCAYVYYCAHPTTHDTTVLMELALCYVSSWLRLFNGSLFLPGGWDGLGVCTVQQGCLLAERLVIFHALDKKPPVSL